ncbi:MAG: iron transporter FeoB [Candidatus Syntrophoarchaeum butanivorans]|uniref:Iron transporter FeoB n=1 Tax=Candidatus Syntropharchaeum butanivorans TaxID=1839936 RepID=A0A1F2P3E5_9EURY|nr:MAG: iron transporter FeoB [Candidatus Syntrophoarchaeum butanivorans]
MRIFLVGNPNVGKSTLFKELTGARIIISNYPGTTVDYYTSRMNLNGNRVEVVDVPGIYSLNPTSEAENVAVRILEGCSDKDAVINVVDGTNLRRNLFLTLDLLEKGYPVMLAVNMIDMLEGYGLVIDLEGLEEIFGVPVVGVSARKGDGIEELRSRIADRRSVSLEEVLNGCSD